MWCRIFKSIVGHRCSLQGLLPVLIAGLWGCGPKIMVPALEPSEVPQLEAGANILGENYRLEPGDVLEITYPHHPEMDQQEATIEPNGTILTVSAGEMEAAGLTVRELRRMIVRRSSEYLRDPQVNVRIARLSEKLVYVAGEVPRPGIIPYQQGLSPLQAVFAAGGFLDTAKANSVILIRTVDEGNLIARKLDLQTALIDGTNGVPTQIALAPRDVLFVPKTPIAHAGVWVEQHVTRLVPYFRGVGASFRIPPGT